MYGIIMLIKRCKYYCLFYSGNIYKVPWIKINMYSV